MIVRFFIAIVATAGFATAQAADLDATTVSDKGVGALKAAWIDTGGDFARIDAAAAGMGWRKLTDAEVAEVNATQLRSRMPVLTASAWGGEFEGVPMWLLYATERDRSTNTSADDRMRSCDILAPPGDQPAIQNKLKAVCPGKVTSEGVLFGLFIVIIERKENGMRIGCDYYGGTSLRIPSFNGGKPYDVFSYDSAKDPKRE